MWVCVCVRACTFECSASICSFAFELIHVEWTRVLNVIALCARTNTRPSTLFRLFHIGVNTFTWFPQFLAEKNAKKIRRARSPPENNNFIVIALLHFQNELLPYSQAQYMHIVLIVKCLLVLCASVCDTISIFPYHTQLHIAPSRLLSSYCWMYKFFLISCFVSALFVWFYVVEIIRFRCMNTTYIWTISKRNCNLPPAREKAIGSGYFESSSLSSKWLLFLSLFFSKLNLLPKQLSMVPFVSVFASWRRKSHSNQIISTSFNVEFIYLLLFKISLFLYLHAQKFKPPKIVL